jgi:hypothetical protein
MATRPKVNPRTQSPSHEISISDGVQTFGLRLDDGVRSIQETPMTASTLLINSQGGKFGDYDPSMSHIQQNSWIGGRGQENFAEDASRYFDSKNLWTATPDMIFPSLQWKYATGYRTQDMAQVGDNYNWVSLAGLWLSRSFAASASYNADKCNLWIKRVGTPGTLTISIAADSAGKPGTDAITATKTTADLAENIASWISFDWTGTVALTSGTTYHIVAKGATTDNIENHWEIMTSLEASPPNNAYLSLDAGTWTLTNYKLYYRVVAADVAQFWKFFSYNGKSYAYSTPGNGTTQLFEANGTAFTEITSTGLTVATDVKIANGIVYFAQGESVNIRRWNGTTWADDGTNKATLLYVHYDETDGAQVWRAIPSTSKISRAATTAWGTNLVFGTEIAIGDTTSLITGLCGYNNSLWVFKKDSVWAVKNDKAAKLDVGIDDALSQINGSVSVSHGLYLYFNFVTSLERLYGGTLDDVGPSRGSGMPADRTGSISALDSVMSTLFVGIDGRISTRYSSVMIFDGINYHEIWRAPEIGKRVQSIKWQSRSDDVTTLPILWIDYVGDIVNINFPRFSMKSFSALN